MQPLVAAVVSMVLRLLALKLLEQVREEFMVLPSSM